MSEQKATYLIRNTKENKSKSVHVCIYIWTFDQLYIHYIISLYGSEKKTLHYMNTLYEQKIVNTSPIITSPVGAC